MSATATPPLAAKQPATIDKREVADELQVSTRTVERWIEEGRIPAPTKIGGLVRWPRTTIERWIEAGFHAPSL